MPNFEIVLADKTTKSGYRMGGKSGKFDNPEDLAEFFETESVVQKKPKYKPKNKRKPATLHRQKKGNKNEHNVENKE